MPRYAALLRAIAHVKMDGMRSALEAMGYADVTSFGMSGNLFFTSSAGTRAALQKRIGAEFHTVAMVRTRAALQRAVDGNPYRGESGTTIMFLVRAPDAKHRAALNALDVTGPPPVLRGDVLWFRWPLSRKGRRGPIDFEKLLGVQGTARSANVVESMLKRGFSA